MLRSVIRILLASLAQIDTEMAEKYANQRYAVTFRCKDTPHHVSASQLSQWSTLMVLVTLTFDLLTLKLASKVGNLNSEFGHARPTVSWVIRYVREGRTDGQTGGQTKATLIAPSPTVGAYKLSKLIISQVSPCILVWQ